LPRRHEQQPRRDFATAAWAAGGIRKVYHIMEENYAATRRGEFPLRG